MPTLLNYVGRKFGRLKVLARAKTNSASGRVQWRCRCKCGAELDVIGQSLGNPTQSCGCLLKQRRKRGFNRKHGLCTTKHRHPLYWIWQAMLQRCQNKKCRGWKNYGARGIHVCSRWKDFSKFVADIGTRPKHAYLDRENNDGDYCPENCRWVTPKTSARNTRRASLITINGRTQCLADWADERGVRYRTAYYRIHTYGWTYRRAVMTPVATSKRVTSRSTGRSKRTVILRRITSD